MKAIVNSKFLQYALQIKLILSNKGNNLQFNDKKYTSSNMAIWLLLVSQENL